MRLRKTAILFACCLFSCLLFGQPKTFNVGIDAFPNQSYYGGSNSDRGEYRKKASINIGIVASYQHNNVIGFESGLKYVNRGHRGEVSTYFFDTTISVPTTYAITGSSVTNFNYLSIPLNVRLSLSDSFKKGIYLRFGFSTDFYLSSNLDYDLIDERVGERKVSINHDDDVRNTLLNLNYGVGYSFLFPNNFQLSVEPSFEYMFLGVYTADSNFKYNSLGIKLRFMFL